MKKIVINYTQHWNNYGTHYNQVIKLDKKFIKYINKLINNYYESNNELKNIICDTIGISKYYDCYLKPIVIENNISFLNNTQLKFIYYYLKINKYDVKRIKDRNTMIRIEEC